MYCSIHEAWDNKNSLSNLSKRYQENFNPSLNDELSTYKINKNNISYKSSQKPKFRERHDARYNKDDSMVFDNGIIDTQTEDIQTEDIQTEDIILSSIEPEIVKPIKSVYKNKKLECEQLVKKVLSCPTCRKMLENKLNINKNPLQNLVNNEMREIMILILIGLVIMIIIDLFIRVST